MKKTLIIGMLFLLVGCGNKLTCTIEDNTGSGKMIFTFKDEEVSKLKATLKFDNKEDAKVVCSLYEEFATDEVKVKCSGKKITMESSKASKEYTGMTKEELQKQLEESGYTCK